MGRTRKDGTRWDPVRRAGGTGIDGVWHRDSRDQVGTGADGIGLEPGQREQCLMGPDETRPGTRWDQTGTGECDRDR